MQAYEDFQGDTYFCIEIRLSLYQNINTLGVTVIEIIIKVSISSCILWQITDEYLRFNIYCHEMKEAPQKIVF